MNRPKPPLDFAEASFDLIYGISVFTHIDRASQECWLAELYRLLRPGGVLLLTVNGESAGKHAGISLRDLEGLWEEGVKFLTYNKLSGIPSGLVPDEF